MPNSAVFERGQTMRRRDFMKIIGSVAANWPIAAEAQQTQRKRRIGVFMSAPPEDPRTQAQTAALLQGLQELGWTVGRNVQLEWRWYVANDIALERTRRNWSPGDLM